VKACLEHFAESMASGNESRIKAAMKAAKTNKAAFKAMPRYTYTVEMQRMAVASLDKKTETIVYLARWQDKKVRTIRRIKLQQQGSKWVIRSW